MMIRTLGVAAVGAFVLFTARGARADEACAMGLALGVSADAATAVTAAFCGQARATTQSGMLRVSVVFVGGVVTVAATRTEVATGKEESARIQSRTIEEAIRSAPLLIAKLRGSAPEPSPPRPTPAKPEDARDRSATEPAPPKPEVRPSSEPPRAAEGEVVVSLNNGKDVRGAVVAAVRGDYCTLRQEDGTLVRIPWSAIRRIEPNLTGENAAEPAPAVGEPPAREGEKKTPKLEAGPKTHVEIHSPRSVQLQRNENGTWVTACMSPCNDDVPTVGEYRIVDEGGHAKSAFQLDSAAARIDVSPRSTALDVVGVVVGVTGALMGYGALVADEDAQGPLAGAAAIAIAGGLTAILANDSSVKLSGAKSSAPADPRSSDRPRAGLSLASVRRPGFSLPILSFSF